MTVLANSSITYYCRITLALRSNPATTIELFIGNREFDDVTVPVYAALKEIVGIGNELSGHIPALTTGKIVIDNSAGIFGGNKRFSDYLEQYTIINQDVRIYYNTTESLDEPFKTTSTAVLFWRDLIFNCTYNDKQATLSLRSDLISNKTVNYKFKDTIKLDIVNTPVSSTAIGKTVPLVFGTQYVKPFFVTNEHFPYIYYYALATNFANDFVNSATSKVYARHRDGEYVEIAQGTGGLVYGSGSVGTGGGSDLPTNIGGQAWKITTSVGRILDQMYFTFYKQAGGPAEEEITLGIWSKHPNRDKPDKLLTSGGSLLMSDYATGWHGATVFFDPPLVVKPDETFYMGFYTDTQSDGTVARARYFQGTVTYNTKKYKTASGTGEIAGRWKGGEQSPNQNYRMGLYALDVNFVNLFLEGFEIRPDSEGLQCSFLEMQANVGRTDVDSIKNLDLIVLLEGIKDDSSGTITGTPNQLLQTPHHIANLLSRTWNGSSWAVGNFNSSTYSATHANHTNTGSNYYRLIGGVATGAIQRNRLLAAIGQESLTYFPRVNAANEFAMYSLGFSSNPVAQITDKDIFSLRVSISDMSGVVTIAKGSYLKDLRRSDFIEQISLGGESNYSQFIELRYDDSGIGQSIAANSHTLYGENETAKKTYDWISDATSMRNVLKGIMGINQHPPVFVELDISFLKYNTLKLFDNVELITPQLPMLEGANTRHHPALYNTNETTPSDTDNETFLGYSYRASIISIRYDLMQTSLPIMNIRLRLILNEADPT